MSNVTDLLLGVIRSEVCGKEFLPTSLGDGELEELFRLSKEQDMVHIVGAWATKLGLADGELGERLTKAHMMAVYRYQQITFELKRISAILERNKIKYIPLKGSVIRSLYPSAWMRTSCDIDILVSEDELDRAIGCLVSEAKYTTDGARAYHDVSLYAPSGVHLELHFNILENAEQMDGVLSRVWEHAQPRSGEYGYAQTPEFLMFHQIAHAAYHFRGGGCGLRPVLDIWLLKEKTVIDGDALESLLREAGLLFFAESILDLGDAWFGDGEHTDLTRKMESFILGAYIYGSAENRIAVEKSKRGGSLGYVLNRLFMPYKFMKIKYPVLKKCPILLPFCHIARWSGLLLPKKRRQAATELKQTREITDEKAEKVSSLCRELDLKF
ncbi:MAG: nucleotidyltransferase family protein [Clostridia bacterium]|nr:nucleotidyltransferase family protein [Clostridia bacterium]